MKELTEKQQILVGLAITKTLHPDNDAYFYGVYESTVAASMPIALKHLSSVELSMLLDGTARQLPNTAAADECDSREKRLRKRIEDIEAEAVAAYPCILDETRQHITFDAGYYFETENSTAHCVDGVAKVSSIPDLRYGNDDAKDEARCLMDFYLHPCKPESAEDYARSIEECYNDIYTARSNSIK